MNGRTYAGVGRVGPEELGCFEAELPILTGLDGIVFLDPLDGVHPLYLAQRVRCAAPDLPVVLPLVTRDRNRTALLAEARAMEAFGASGVLAVTGHLDPTSPVRTVYEVDPLQLLHLLGTEGIGVEPWVAGRFGSPAARARAVSLFEAGAARCVTHWGGVAPEAPGIPVVHRVEEGHWRAGDLPPDGDRLLVWQPGAGSDLAAVLGGAA